MSEMKVGPNWGGSGTFGPFTSGFSGAQRVVDAHGKYLDAVLGNRVFQLSVAGGAATAYTGGAAGTPLIAVHNPDNSGKYLALLAAGIASRVAASAAGTVGFNLWAGPSVLPTGTPTTPRNLLSQASGGAVGVGFSNAALTGSTALGLLLPLASYYWATGAGAFVAPVVFDLAGLVVVAPGNQVALGATAALTSATYDVALIWEELPLLS